jgi:hypothetical protein
MLPERLRLDNKLIRAPYGDRHGVAREDAVLAVESGGDGIPVRSARAET